jgi:hypothetical protein
MSEHADRELIRAIRDLVHKMSDLQIIMNRFPDLGITVWSVDLRNGDHQVIFDNGLDEVAELINRNLKILDKDLTPRREVAFNGCKFVQYPRQKNYEYMPRRSPCGGTATINGKTQIYTEAEIEKAREEGTLG